MDGKRLNEVICKEHDALTNLLKLLEEQHELLIQNDVIGLEDMVQRINLCNKSVAETEIERRKLVGNESMKDLIYSLRNEELDTNYRKVKKLLHSLNVQKETNALLIKLGLGFSTKMLNILNPGRTQRTYNSYGKITR